MKKSLILCMSICIFAISGALIIKDIQKKQMDPLLLANVEALASGGLGAPCSCNADCDVGLICEYNTFKCVHDPMFHKCLISGSLFYHEVAIICMNGTMLLPCLWTKGYVDYEEADCLE